MKTNIGTQPENVYQGASDQRSTAIVMRDMTTLVRFVIRRIHVAFHREYISTPDTLARGNTAAEAVSSRTRSGHRHHPPAPLQLNEEDEDLQLQEGVEINMNEFRVLFLHMIILKLAIRIPLCVNCENINFGGLGWDGLLRIQLRRL
ncbi:hypothetical protein BDC45DRAFT_561573 [Circinella umbellata]|nr:hypothetical protein BDC45DRAFT_561573 [Circinella umbellata]